MGWPPALVCCDANLLFSSSKVWKRNAVMQGRGSWCPQMPFSFTQVQTSVSALELVEWLNRMRPCIAEAWYGHWKSWITWRGILRSFPWMHNFYLPANRSLTPSTKKCSLCVYSWAGNWFFRWDVDIRKIRASFSFILNPFSRWPVWEMTSMCAPPPPPPPVS